MESSPVLALAAIAVVILACAILTSAIRVRKHRERLVTMGSRHNMGLIQGKLSGAAIEHARRFGRRKQKVKLRDILMGEDDAGRFHFAERSIARHKHHVLFAMNSSETYIEDFHVTPRLASNAPKRRWYQSRPRIQPGSDWRFELEWTSPRSRWLEGQSLGISARVLSLLARMSDAPGAVPMGVEIHARSLLIHSDRPLSGDRIDRFVDDAVRLRRQILQTVRKVEGKTSDRLSGARMRELESVEVQVLRPV